MRRNKNKNVKLQNPPCSSKVLLSFTDIEWPEGEEALSEEAVNAIEALLTMDPKERPAAAGVRQMPLFKNIDWENLLNTEPPFTPTPDDMHDTGYFQGE